MLRLIRAPTASAWPISPAAFMRRLGPAPARSTGSAAPISPPPFRKNRRPRSSNPARRLGQSRPRRRPNSPISTGLGSSIPTHREHGRHRVHAGTPMRGFMQLRDDGKPALIFAAHLANWELPALVADRYGLDTHGALPPPEYRRGRATRSCKSAQAAWARWSRPASTRRSSSPRALEARRPCRPCWSTSITPRRRRDVLRPPRARPTRCIARLARHFDCPIHGTRVVRLPTATASGVELTEAIEPPRDAAGDDRRRTAPCRRSRRWSKAGCASIPSNGCGCTGAGGERRGHFPVLIRVHSRFISPRGLGIVRR